MTPLRLCLIYGRFTSSIHGQFDIPGLYETAGLTGSESSFFNLAWGLGELGCQVDVFCDVPQPYLAVPKLAGANVYPLSMRIGPDYDAYVSWNEPDELRRAPKGRLRIVDCQLNDFAWCSTSYSSYVDWYVSPADIHRDYLVRTSGTPADRWAVIPNSINLEFTRTEAPPQRVPYSMAWCSSPDRGLHRLLEMYPIIRDRFPEAQLKIYYRVKPWLERMKDDQGVTGTRARFVAEAFRRLGTNGENGVTLVDVVSNKQIAQELLATWCLPYTCDPIIFTEGFGVSVMDACAAGCIPIISDADALGDIYGREVVIVPGRPGDSRQIWVDSIIDALRTDHPVIRQNLRLFARRYHRTRIARQWLNFIEEKLARPRTSAPEVIDFDGDPPALGQRETLEAIGKLWQDLLAHDEILNARALLDAAPWQVRDCNEVLRMRRLTDRMLAHVDDPTNYRHVYADYGYTGEALPLHLPVAAPEMAARYEFCAEAIVAAGEGATVLDVGCLDGWMTNRFARDLHARAFGVDFSEKAIATGQRVAKEHNTGAEFFHGFFGENLLPRAWPQKFDVVVCCEMYEHVPNTRRLLADLWGHVKPGGTLIITCPRGSWLQGHQVPYHEKWNLAAPREHVRAPIKSELKADLVATGGVEVMVREVIYKNVIPGQGTLLGRARRA